MNFAENPAQCLHLCVLNMPSGPLLFQSKHKDLSCAGGSQGLELSQMHPTCPGVLTRAWVFASSSHESAPTSPEVHLPA